jgi:hypothetical protein
LLFFDGSAQKLLLPFSKQIVSQDFLCGMTAEAFMPFTSKSYLLSCGRNSFYGIYLA